MLFITIDETCKELVMNGIVTTMDLLDESKGEIDIAGVVDWGNPLQSDKQRLNDGLHRLSVIYCTVEDGGRLTGDQLGCVLCILRDAYSRYCETNGEVDRIGLNESGHGILGLQELIAKYSSI